jgi:hypothetical protein
MGLNDGFFHSIFKPVTAMEIKFIEKNTEN